MRLLRGAGARGLAAMYAPRPGVVRPLARRRRPTWPRTPRRAGSRGSTTRRTRRRGTCATACAASSSRRCSRSRPRSAPSCSPPPGPRRVPRGARPHAAALAAAAAPTRPRPRARRPDAGRPPRATGGPRRAALAALWPALAAAAGVRLDRRGTAVSPRLQWTCRGAPRRPGARGRRDVAGGASVAVERRGAPGAGRWVLVVAAAASRGARGGDPGGAVPLDGRRCGRACGSAAGGCARSDGRPRARAARAGAWRGCRRSSYAVRPWRPGDRWQPAPGATARRVKRFLADRRVPALARAGWPVVVVAPIADAGPAARGAAEGEIVWVPGVRRSSAAPARPGQPGFYLLCERTPERRRPPGR
jgi:tRNA(Ile)-lysidine synthetase-like protein